MTTDATRIVITGIGLVTPLGSGVAANWERLIAGQSGIGKIARFRTDDLPCRVGGEVPVTEGQPHRFDAETVVSSKERRRMDDFIVYAMGAAEEAIKDSGWVPPNDEARERTGVMIGSGIGGLATIDDTAKT